MYQASSQAERLERLAALPALGARMRSAEGIGELFACAGELARVELGFQRGVVLGLERGRLTAAHSDPSPHPESDRLRREILASPTVIAARVDDERAWSDVAAALGLRQFAVGPVQLQSRVLAALVLDREDGPVDATDRAGVAVFGTVLGVALTETLLRVRMRDVSTELRALTVAADALIAEATAPELVMPTAQGWRSTFPLTSTSVPGPDGVQVSDLLTKREIEVAELVAQGLSNRVIAERLVLSAETVKRHVSRVLRKLDASTRAELVSRYLHLTQARGESSPDRSVELPRTGLAR